MLSLSLLLAFFALPLKLTVGLIGNRSGMIEAGNISNCSSSEASGNNGKSSSPGVKTSCSPVAFISNGGTTYKNCLIMSDLTGPFLHLSSLSNPVNHCNTDGCCISALLNMIASKKTSKMTWYISVINFGLMSASKLSLLQFSVFVSSTATLASEALLLMGVFLPFRSPTLCQSSYNCCHCDFEIES